MQTVLLAREIGRLMTWDCNTKRAVNKHLQKVCIISKALSYMDTRTTDNVFQS